MKSKGTIFEYFCLVLILGGLVTAFIGSALSVTAGILGAGSLFLGLGLIVGLRDGQMPGIIFIFIGAGLIICTLLWMFTDDPLDAERIIDYIVPVLIVSLFGIFGALILWNAWRILMGTIAGTMSQFIVSLLMGLALVGVSLVIIIGMLTGRIIAVSVS